MYTALEIAKYIINKCLELNRPISNLQLQKILYYVQGEYIKKTNGEVLFKDKIVAWGHGPSVPSVYFEYNNYCSSEIVVRQNNIELNQLVMDIIDPIINEKSSYSSWSLVEMTQKENPWINTFVPNSTNIITINELRKWFKIK